MTFSNQLYSPSIMDHRPTVNGHSNGDPKHIFVFDNMRLRSHLFWRWISTHPDLHSVYHPYLDAGFLGPDTILSKIRETQVRLEEVQHLLKYCGNDETYEMSNRRLEEEMEKAEKMGKRLFANEHLVDMTIHYIQSDFIRRGDRAFPCLDFEFPNPTYMSDRLMKKFTPVILIRHPVLQVQSLYTSMSAYTKCRPGGENFDCITSSHFTRLIFEYFRLSRGKPPIVIDGEDTLWRTEELGANFCNAFGIDHAGLKEKWDPLPEEWWSKNPFIHAMTQTIHESTGIERPAEKPKEPNVDEFFQKWTERYGPEVAQQLKSRVDAAMPHYEYLVQFKI